MTSFEKRCELLNYMMIGTYGDPAYKPFRDEYDLYIYSAVATHLDLVTPGPIMVSHINNTFEAWLYIVGKEEDKGYKTIWEIDPNIELFEIDEFFSSDLKDSIESDFL